MPKAKPQKSKNHKKLKIFALAFVSILLLVLIALQAWFDVRVNTNNAKLENFQIRTYIYDQIRQSNKQANTDAKTGEIYLTDAKLVLPKPPERFNRGVLYTYNAPTSDNSESITITSNIAQEQGLSLINMYYTQDRMFDAVPAAQACTRQVTMFIQPEKGSWSEGLEQFHSGKLADGRSYKMYVDKQCPDNSKYITEYLKSIQSY